MTVSGHGTEPRHGRSRFPRAAPRALFAGQQETVEALRADPPGVVHEYAPGRGGKHDETLLKGFQGTVQVDGYFSHRRLARLDRPGGALTLATCWTHARRGLTEVFDSNGSPIAKAGLERIAQLYRIEDRIWG